MADQMDIQTCAENYAHLKEDELEAVLRDYDDLTEEAKLLISSEARKRGKKQPEIEQLIDSGRKRRLPVAQTTGIDTALTQKLGGITQQNGFGRTFHGRSRPVTNEEYGFEEYNTTLWWSLFFLPILPRGSFRIRRKLPLVPVPEFFFNMSYELAMVEKLPFLWTENIPRLVTAAVVWLIAFDALLAEISYRM